MADIIEITAEVRGRELRLTSIPMMPSGSRNHVQIRVTLDAEWEGTTKTLVAYRDLSHPYHVPLGMDGTALIPHEVLAEQGVVYLGVFGIAGDQRITSTIVRYGVNEGAITDGLTPSDPTPEMWEQLIAAVNEVRQVAESAMRDAQTAAQGAHRSEQAAAKSATRAEGAATRSETAADVATTSARDAETAKTDAQTAQRAAAQSAADAKTAATRAEQAAGELSTAVAQVQDAAQAAQQSATQAQESAKSAGDSAASAVQAQQGATDAETAARQSATQAQKSQETATQAATNAGKSAQQADTAKTAAQNSAQSAGEQANAAATSAQQAQQSQTAAAGSATSAHESAAEATEQAGAAEASAVRAETAATEVEQSAQQIAGAIDRLVIHETAAGNPVVIRDSADWQMEGLRVYGQSEQVTTTGAQMFDSSTRIVGGIINNGVQASNSRYACSDYIPIPDGTTHLYQSGGALNQRGFYGVDKAYLSKPTTNNVIDVPEGAKYIRITSNIDNQDMGNIMLCAGNTAKPFEPYTGGKPAPSPEYPQEIVSREVAAIVATGKNLVDAETLDISHYTRVSLQNRIIPGVYTFSGNASTNAESDSLLISCLDADGKLVASVYLQIGEKKSATVTIKGEVAQLQIYAARNNAAAIGKEAKISEFQIEIGSVATKYESYHAQTVKLSAPVTLRGVPVKTGGTVTIGGKQYVADRITEREGVVGVKRCTAMIGQYAGEPVDEPYISTTGALTTGASVVHTIPEEFTPLPEQDQQAIRALRTYHGNTVVTTGAHTEVDYVADPKLYIDGKVTSLVTAYMQSIPVTIPLLDEEVVDHAR